MIVIATNRGWHCIEKSVEYARTFNQNEKIVIVDTQSNDNIYIQCLKDLSQKYDCLLEVSPYKHYDFGAYMHAYNLFKNEDWFFFHHDSVHFKSSDAIPKLKEKISENDVCAWVTFTRNIAPFDSDEQKNWLIRCIGSDDYDFGVYGPNLCIKRNTLQKLEPVLNKIIVDCKWKQQGMERGWSIIFKQHGIQLNALEDHEPSNFNRKFYQNEFVYFKKILNQTRS